MIAGFGGKSRKFGIERHRYVILKLYKSMMGGETPPLRDPHPSERQKTSFESPIGLESWKFGIQTRSKYFSPIISIRRNSKRLTRRVSRPFTHYTFIVKFRINRTLCIGEVRNLAYQGKGECLFILRRNSKRLTRRVSRPFTHYTFIVKFRINRTLCIGEVRNLAYQ